MNRYIFAGAALVFAPFLITSAARAQATPGYDKSVLVPPLAGTTPGTSVHGISGMNFGKDGKLYAASVVGAGVHRIDVKTGTIEQVVLPPMGESDDVAMASDGTLVWTAILSGEVRARRPNGTIETLATNLPSVNPVNFAADGRLIVGQITRPDTLVEIDRAGKKSPRILGSDLGAINAFCSDGKNGLYVPLREKGAVGRFDLTTNTMSIVADGFDQPVAVKRDSHGNIYTIETFTGKVVYINPESGETIKLATVSPPLDNIAIAADDTIYVSRPTDNTIIAIDHETGKQTPLIQGAFSAPGGLVATQLNGRPTLLVADPFGYRFTDPVTGVTETLPFDQPARSSTSIAANDKLIVTSNVRNSNVVVIDKASGRVLHTVKSFKEPMGVAVTETGEIYVAEYGSGEILKVLPNAMPDRVRIAVDLQGPVGLGLDKAGKLVVSEAVGGTIARIDRITGQREVIAQNLMQPEGLVALADGRIVVAEVGKKQITSIDDAGATTPLATDLPLDTFITRTPAPVYLPTGVTVDAKGAVYVTVGGDNSLLKFTPRTN
jgi:sugar lactone lactonase YvrE